MEAAAADRAPRCGGGALSSISVRFKISKVAHWATRHARRCPRPVISVATLVVDASGPYEVFVLLRTCPIMSAPGGDGGACEPRGETGLVNVTGAGEAYNHGQSRPLHASSK